MRMSAATIKGWRKKSYLMDKPAEGTVIRATFDKAMTGDWFHWSDFTESNSTLRMQLEGYNLELISEPDPTASQRARRRYRCIGVWDGADLKTLEDVRVALENSVLRDDKGLKEN